MAIISGVTVDWRLSPRVITIPDTETEVTIDDLQDTLLDLEDDDEGMMWPHLRNTSGGEQLDENTDVGLTMELQNARLQFESRPTPLDDGSGRTCDANNAAGTQLYVDDADFVSDGIYAGCTVFNATTGDMATVTEVVNLNTLNHQSLDGGAGGGWTIGDNYYVYPNVSCVVSGGNLVAVDGVGAAINPIFPSPNTHVTRTSSASATSTNLSAIQYSSFNGGVTIDVDNGAAGTDYPLGTSEFPVNNLTDAQTVSVNNGFHTIFVEGTLTIDETDDIDNYIFEGIGSELTYINLVRGCSTEGTVFKEMTVYGHQNGETHYVKCEVGSAPYPLTNTDASQTITVDAAAGTFTRSAGDYTTDGFEEGMRFTAEGLVNNEGPYFIDTVTATVITIISSEWSSLTNEAGDGDEQLSEYNGLTNVHCKFENCKIVGPVVMHQFAQDTSNFIDCYSGVAGLGTPTMDMNAGPMNVAFRRYAGSLEIINCSNSLVDFSFDINSGRLILASDVTAGSFVIRGVGTLVNNGTPDSADDSGLISTEKIERVRFAVENLQGTHFSIGDSYYVDPGAADDTADGRSPDRPFKYVQTALDACTSENNDLIQIINSDNVIDEQITISKNDVSIRGLGRGTVFRPTATTGDTITITGTNVSLQNIRVETENAVGTTQHAITVSANDARIQRCWIYEYAERGINITDGVHHTEIDHCDIESSISGTVGIYMDNTVETLIHYANIWKQTTGIYITGTANDNAIDNSTIHDMGTGIYIDTDVTHTYVRRSNDFANMGVQVNNQGDTTNHDFRTEEAASAVDGVWGVSISDLTDTTTIGGYIRKKLLSVGKFIGLK